jgi:hypothetical protein
LNLKRSREPIAFFLNRLLISSSMLAVGGQAMSTNYLEKLPADLPVPVDDGAASHLTGLRLPFI